MARCERQRGFKAESGRFARQPLDRCSRNMVRTSKLVGEYVASMLLAGQWACVLFATPRNGETRHAK